MLRDRPKKPNCRPKHREANVLDPAGLFAVLRGLAPGNAARRGRLPKRPNGSEQPSKRLS
jgi:hypothetical protein